MNHIIPAILAQDEATFRSELTTVEELASTVQLDVLDDTLYPNASWCDLDTIDAMQTPTWIELHLMVADPARYLDKIHRGGPIHRALWHVEAQVDHADLFLTCEHIGIEYGLALSPKTPIEVLDPFADGLSEVLVLGVEPGFSGQALIPETVEKVRAIRARWPHLLIGFDGGVTVEHVPDLRDAGVTRFYAASSIWNTSDPKAAYDALHHA